MKKWTIKLTALMTALALAAGSFTGGFVAQTATTVNAASGISSSQAKKIALKNASTSSSRVKAMDCYKTYKNGKNVYHVSFYKKTGSNQYTHYVFDISSRTGEVVKRNSKAYTIISASRAKSIAIDDSDVSSGDAKDKSADLDEEDGKLVWNVTFTSKKEKTYYYSDYDYYYGYGGSYSYKDTVEHDYSYTINAVTGHIIDSDDDDDDDDD